MLRPAIRSLYSPVNLLRFLIRGFIRLRVVWIILIAIVFLSGCVRYETGLNFSDANHGEWVQRIRLEKVPTGLSETIAAGWLDSVKEKAKQFGGRADSISEEELWLRIPFYSAKDLESKFNQFFQPPGTIAPTGGTWKQRDQKSLNLPIRVKVETRQWLFREREYLTLDFDFRPLKTLLAQSGLTVKSDDLLELEFRLKTPAGAKILQANGVSEPILRSQGKQILWQLKPGQLNHLELAFTVPNYLGTGFVVILLITLTGMLIKFLMLPPTAVLPPEVLAEEVE
ncbi:DUF3153 domain-containing protein [Leptolyngbya ohadii]|uniref:DUF3153 domain-containing protein n=1 Tax=Leptolyngbya ohadii TaxID=1962290 RepID=UPI000B59D3F8|nr:DUF3153 domain-containing protein [Leptolyngbya ohadii]